MLQQHGSSTELKPAHPMLHDAGIKLIVFVVRHGLMFSQASGTTII
jgi:hypothetical protein